MVPGIHQTRSGAVRAAPAWRFRVSLGKQPLVCDAAKEMAYSKHSVPKDRRGL